MKVFRLVEPKEKDKQSFLNEEDVNSLIDLIVSRGNYSSYSFSMENSDSPISINDSVVLRINIKGSANLFGVFPKDNFPTEEVVEKVFELKEMKVYDENSAKERTNATLDIVKNLKPYFLIYQCKSGNILSQEAFASLLNEKGLDNVELFYREKTEEVVEAPKEEVKQESNVKENKFKADLRAIKENKYHFIFVVVSTFLFGFASAVGYCNAAIQKPIAALFFICAGIGMFLDTFVYKDYFAEKKITNRLFFYSVGFNFVGVLLSFGASLIFYSLDKSGVKTAVSAKNLVLISLGMCAAMIVLSIAIAFAIQFVLDRFAPKKKEKPKKDNKDDTK